MGKEQHANGCAYFKLLVFLLALHSFKVNVFKRTESKDFSGYLVEWGGGGGLRYAK